MTDYPPSIKFLDNLPVTVKIKYDSPKTGIGKEDRPWFLYGCEKYENDVWIDTSFFATQFLHDFLIFCNVKKDTVAVICMCQRKENKKNKYWTCTINGKRHCSDDMKDSPKQPPQEPKEQYDMPAPSTKPTISDLCLTYKSIHDKVTEMGFTDREVTSSIFIESCRQRLYVRVGDSDDVVDNFEPEIPGPGEEDDMPF